jgi:hypothetical protein
MFRMQSEKACLLRFNAMYVSEKHITSFFRVEA